MDMGGNDASVDNPIPATEGAGMVAWGADRNDAVVAETVGGMANESIRNGASERISWLGLARSVRSVVSRQHNNRDCFAALAWGPGALAGSALGTGGPASGRAQIFRANKNTTPACAGFRSPLISCQTLSHLR